MIRHAFTVIELLVVVAILAIVMAIGFGLNPGQSKDAVVAAAAQELAATLREARGLAMQRQAIHAVSFNIRNALGSTGRVLNNRDGGHWYRILGPDDRTPGGENWGNPTFPLPMRKVGEELPGNSWDKPVSTLLTAVSRSWVGDRHVLPTGRVRFLALADTDNGSYMQGPYCNDEGGFKSGDTFPATYPRPWFGWYDATAQQLYPWGGYDPSRLLDAMTIANERLPEREKKFVAPRSVNGRQVSHSAFFYEGYDGEIIGCRNPADRWVVTDNSLIRDSKYTYQGADSDHSDRPGGSGAPDKSNGWLLLKQGEGRPLINGDWLDFTFIFNPDGTVRQGPFLWMRSLYSAPKYADNIFKPTFPVGDGAPMMRMLGPGDMCNQAGDSIGNGDFELDSRWNQQEITTYEPRTGMWWITLAPDAPNDDDRFPNARRALQSVFPLYRVGINRLGDVRIVRVSQVPTGGAVLDTSLTGSDWEVSAKTNLYLKDGLLGTWSATKFIRQGIPVETFVTEGMLTGRSWWLEKVWP